MQKISNVLYWLSGTDSEIIGECSVRDKMIKSGLGLIFLINYFILLLTWSKVGYRYFGIVGLIPGILTPTAFLAFDRLIAMSQRRMTGPLAVYNDNVHSTKNEIRLRVFMALSLTIMTTLTFQMSLADSIIREKADIEWKKDNADLRNDTVKFIRAKYADMRQKTTTAISALEKDLKVAEDRKAVASKESLESSRKSLEAFGLARGEQGGLEKYAGSKVVSGQGVKMNTADAIANAEKAHKEETTAIFKDAEKKVNDITQNIEKLQNELVGISKSENDELAKLDDAISNNPLYVPKREGLFSDITIFMELFGDPKYAKGVWLGCISTWLFLICLELLALIGLYSAPTGTYDLKMMIKIRQEAGDAIGAYETRRTDNTRPDVIQIEPNV